MTSDNTTRQGNCSEASLYTTIIAHGPNHPKVAVRQNSLGIVFRKMGEYNKARELLEAAFQMQLKILTQNTQISQYANLNLQMFMANLGSTAWQWNFFETALQNDLLNFGDKHPNIATQHYNLAHVLKNTGEYLGAVDHFLKALNILKSNFGEEHPYIDKTNENIIATIQKGAEAGDPDLQKRWAEIQKEQEE
ncbi:MAG: tetratricopeptide repeat protein [Saprospiraceae bacterium]